MRTKSEVWEYFLSDEANISEVICKQAGCEAVVKRCSLKDKQEINTTNAWSHLRAHHLDLYNQILEKKKIMIRKEAVTTWLPLINISQKKISKKEMMNDKIGFMIIRDLQPISFVENEGFKDLIKSFDESYSIPGRYFFSQTWIPKKYKEVKKIIKEKLKLLGHWCALTTDGWTNYSGQSYLSISFHQLSDSWKRENYFLTLHPLMEDHTSDYLNKVMRKTLEEYDLKSDRIVSITHDQGSNIK